MKRTSALSWLALFLLAGCQISQQQYLSREEQGKSYLADYLNVVRRAEGARLRVWLPDPIGKEKTFIFSMAEVALLKDIILHSKPVPPSSDRDWSMLPEEKRSSSYLILTNAAGETLREVLLENSWTSESSLLKLSPDRRQNIADPIWYLPDCDFDTLLALPTMKAAEQWSRAE